MNINTNNLKDDSPTVPGHTITQSEEHRGDWVLFHPVYTPSELKAVKVLRHEPKNIPDRLAGLFVRGLRCEFARPSESGPPYAIGSDISFFQEGI